MMGKYFIKGHALDKARDLGWTRQQIELVAERPSITYANSRPGTMRHIRDGICAIVDPVALVVITVHPSTRETPIRPDQMSDPKAVEYEKKRRRRDGH